MQNTDKSHIPYLIVMQWLMIAGLMGFGIFMAWDAGLLPEMLAQDNTRLSILILMLFFVASVHCFERSLFLSRQFEVLHGFNGNAQVPLLPNSPVSQYLMPASSKQEKDQTLLAEFLAEKIRGQHQIGWFITGALIKLGLLGTVIGFMLMLGSLDDIQSMDLEQVQTLMQTMTQGMKIALNTTLLGLGSSLLLGIQYLYLDRRADQLIAQSIQCSQQQTSTGIQQANNVSAKDER